MRSLILVFARSEISLAIFCMLVPLIASPAFAQDDEIVIEAASESGNEVPRRASGVTRTDATLMETPNSVQVVPEKILRDQQAQTLSEATRNVSNIGNARADSFGDTLSIRGFETPLFLLDGLPDATSQAGFGPLELARFSRVEVLKGPASILFGSVEPGGSINLVTKTPTPEARYSAELQHGRFQNNAAIVDLSAPLNADKSVSYRLVGVYRNADSFRDGVESERAMVAPALLWSITPDTTLTLFGHYQQDAQRADNGVPAIRDPAVAFLRQGYSAQAPQLIQQALPADEIFPRTFILDERVSDERYFGNRERERNEQTNNSGGFLWESDFGDWRFRNQTRGASSSTIDSRTLPTALDADNRTLGRAFDEVAWYAASYSTHFSLDGKIKSGWITHRPYVGVDLNHVFLKGSTLNSFADAGGADLYLTNAQLAAQTNPGDPASALLLDRFDPPFRLSSYIPLFGDQRAFYNSGGITARYQLSFGDHLHLLAGLRYDRLRGELRDKTFNERRNLLLVESLFTNPETYALRADALSPQGGVLFRPIRQLALFLNASEAFTQDFRALLSLGPAPRPVRSVGYEGGFKFEFLDGDLMATVAGFEIRKTNIVVPDPLDARRLLQSGEQTHRGFETDLQAMPLPGLQLILSYGYVDAVTSRDETRDPATGRKLLEGNRPGNVPEHNANAWVVYEIQHGPLEGFGVGMGAFYNSERFASGRNELVLPQYTIANGLLYYRRERLRASMNIKNIYNQRYVEAAGDTLRLRPGRPFEIIGAVTITI